jgi:hypothetical protein
MIWVGTGGAAKLGLLHPSRSVSLSELCFVVILSRSVPYVLLIPADAN